jgi:hypothetical protein
MKPVLLFLVLTACAAAVVIDAGCDRYSELRLTVPPLGTDPVSAWVAILDSAMTRTCRE